MTRHWRKTAITIAGTALVASAVGSAASASTPPSSGAGGAITGYDESAKCNTPEYTGNLARLEAPDPYTVVMTLCNPDVAIPAKVAFASLGINSSDQLTDTDGLINNPIGTGAYTLGTWDHGSQIVLNANPNYWGTAALTPTAVFQWNSESSQRLVSLQSGAADAIDNLGPNDYATVEGDSSLALVERSPLNVAYLGFNVDTPPFDKPEVREAIALTLDRQRLIDNFFPRGSVTATQFLPPAMFGYEDGFVDFTPDAEKAKQLLADAGYADGLDVTLSYRDVPRGYVAQPTPVVTDIQAQLAEIGINVTLDLQESTTFIDNTSAGTVPFFLLGWGADFPDPTNFMDYHFTGAFKGLGTPFPDLFNCCARPARPPTRRPVPTCTPRPTRSSSSTSRWCRSPGAVRRWATAPTWSAPTPARSPASGCRHAGR